MKRTCSKCNLAGIKIGRVVITGPARCQFCGTEYEVSHYRNLPYTVAIALALMFAFFWISGMLSVSVFLILCGVWLTFDLAWESLVPLQPIGHQNNELQPISSDVNDGVEQSGKSELNKADNE